MAGGGGLIIGHKHAVAVLMQPIQLSCCSAWSGNLVGILRTWLRRATNAAGVWVKTAWCVGERAIRCSGFCRGFAVFSSPGGSENVDFANRAKPKNLCLSGGIRKSYGFFWSDNQAPANTGAPGRRSARTYAWPPPGAERSHHEGTENRQKPRNRYYRS